MIQIFKEDIIFVREIYTHETIDIYSLHQNFTLSPAQVARLINKFLDLRIIIINGSLVSVTDYGKEWIFANRSALLLQKSNEYGKILKNI
jgi:predicted methyltransferase